jgi:voltage-gated sodium channel
MSTIRNSNFHPLIKLLIGEPTVMSVIGLNGVALFLHAFPANQNNAFGEFLEWIDYGCMVYFVFEAALKIWLLGARGYFSSGWNRFDFFIVLAGIPLLLHPPFASEALSAYAIAPLLRMGRFLRFVRLLRFIPNASHIGQGIVRSLKASIGVFLVLLLLNFMLALGATMLFSGLDGADPYFGDPLTSIYSLFKVFTVEGWYEIPDTLADNGASPAWIGLLRFYFIVTVLVGGILGLSLANAVFVDEMTTDNNDDLEHMVTELRAELQLMRQELQNALRASGNGQIEPGHAGASGSSPIEPDGAHHSLSKIKGTEQDKEKSTWISD